MRPVPQPRAVDQVNFMALACAIMTLHRFMTWPGPYRGHTGLFLLFGFIFFSVLFWGVCRLVWPFALRLLGGLVVFTGLLVFLFWWFSSPCVCNIYSEVSRRSHNLTSFVRPWVTESNPCMMSSFGHSFRSDKSTNSSILSSVGWFPTPKGGKFSRYSTIPSMRQMKSWVLLLRGFVQPPTGVPHLAL